MIASQWVGKRRGVRRAPTDFRVAHLPKEKQMFLLGFFDEEQQVCGDLRVLFCRTEGSGLVTAGRRWGSCGVWWWLSLAGWAGG